MITEEETRLRIGDRVKLKKIPRSQQSKSKADWINRIGTIVQIGKVNQSAVIRWEDRRTLDHWPLTALRKVS
jgi:hypothetical protein